LKQQYKDLQQAYQNYMQKEEGQRIINISSKDRDIFSIESQILDLNKSREQQQESKENSISRNL
jgi:hypothetical protein